MIATLLVLAALVAGTAQAPAVTGTSGEPALASPTPTPDRSGIGVPVLFRGSCTPGGGPGACRVTAIGIPADDGTLASIPCDDDAATRAKLAGRYLQAGTLLDIYVRGAETGTFLVGSEDEPSRGCAARANGRRRGAPGSVYDFVALLAEDPVKLSAIRFPSGVTPDARAVAGGSVHGVRRMHDGDRDILVIESGSGESTTVLIAEGNGPLPANWKSVWSLTGVSLVDAFDLGADGHPEVLLESTRGEGTTWTLLRRSAGVWK